MPLPAHPIDVRTLTRRRLTERHPWLYPLAVRVHQARRHAAWLTSGHPLGRPARRGTPELPVRVKKHGSLLLRELSPDEMALQHNKVVNLRLASARTDGVVIRPGETFSFNKAGRQLHPAQGLRRRDAALQRRGQGRASAAASASSPTCCTGCSCTRR